MGQNIELCVQSEAQVQSLRDDALQARGGWHRQREPSSKENYWKQRPCIHHEEEKGAGNIPPDHLQIFREESTSDSGRVPRFPHLRHPLLAAGPGF